MRGLDLDDVAQLLENVQIVDSLLVKRLPDVEADCRRQQRAKSQQLRIERDRTYVLFRADLALRLGVLTPRALESLEVEYHNVHVSIINIERAAQHPHALGAFVARRLGFGAEYALVYLLGNFANFELQSGGIG